MGKQVQLIPAPQQTTSLGNSQNQPVPYQMTSMNGQNRMPSYQIPSQMPGLHRRSKFEKNASLKFSFKSKYQTRILYRNYLILELKEF